MNKKLLSLFAILLIFCGVLRAEVYTGSCGDNVTWAFNTETGILAISGTGDMSDYSSSNQPWYSYMSKISSVKINDGVTSIGKNAFYLSTRINSVSIANTVTEIKDYAFWGGNLTSITIPENVVRIGKNVFYSNDNLKTVYFNNGLEEIGENAFDYCPALEKISLPQSIKKIGRQAFRNCSSLKSISISSGSEVYYSENNCIIERTSKTLVLGCMNSQIPDGVAIIGAGAFWGAEKLTSITIPNSVTTINTRAFSNCGLTSISFPSGVISIGTEAFLGNEFTSLYIPETVQSIGTAAFSGCDKLETLSVSPNNEIYYSENECIIETNTKTIVLGCKNSIIPATAISIGEYAFEYCNGLTSIIIPENITTIGRGAFNCAEGLESVVISNSVAAIPGYAFQSCPLKTIVIGKNVSSIEDYAFLGCNQIADIYCLAKNVPTTKNYSFPSSIKNARLHVPYKLESIYLTTPLWSNCTISAEEFLSDSDVSFANSKNIELDAITYTRTLPNLQWNALFVPFEIPVSDLADDYDVAYINDIHSYDKDLDGEIDQMEMEVIYIKEGTLHANHPYLIRAKSDEAKAMNIVVTDATLYSSAKEDRTSITCSSAYTDFEVIGTYEKMTAQELDGCYAINTSGAWSPIASGASLNPFRLYMTITSRNGSPVKVSENAMSRINIRVQGEDTETGIGEIVDKDAKAEIYDMTGRRLQNAHKGIYIINGKKVIK